VHSRGIVAFHEHVPAPFADAHNEDLDFEIGGRLPLRKHFENPLLRILVFQRRSLRTLEPANHVFHWEFLFRIRLKS